MNQEKNKGAEYDFYGKLPLQKAILLGLQHVFAMFVGNLTPVLIITGLVVLLLEPDLQTFRLRFTKCNVNCRNCYTDPVVRDRTDRWKSSIIMGTSSGFIGVCSSVASVYGWWRSLDMVRSWVLPLSGGLFESSIRIYVKTTSKIFSQLS